jgi:nardilysin
VGNRASLTESELWKQGKIQESMRAHWQKHYHAGRMSITVLGEQDLDTLQAMARRPITVCPQRAHGVPVHIRLGP